MSQLKGRLYMRAEALRAVVDACVRDGGTDGMPQATADWVREEVESIALAAWDDGFSAGYDHVPARLPLPVR